MHQSFNAVLKPDKHAITHHVDDLPLNLCPNRITMLDIIPGTGSLLLEAQRNLLVLLVDTDDDALDFLIELNDLRRMRYPAPAQIGNVQQAVQTSQIHKDAEVGNVLDNALTPLTDLDFRQDFFFAAPPFFFDELAPGYDNISTFHVDLENLAVHLFTDEPADVTGLSDIHLRRRQEDGHANIHEQTALDPPDNFTGDHITFLFRFKNGFPASDQIGFTLVEQDKAAFGVRIFQQHFNFSAGLYFIRALKFTRIHNAFTFETDFDDHIVTNLRHDRTLKNRSRQT